ncbi:ABC-type glycerol-3-phosphate transport system, substrate-binding protein [Anaerobranca californiensis DSM 14826]|jgi:ABC-type glycerol-3-phosphate transport system substrate-binding protein|uniref:ABC-type glycerol-3-phosphate transport system, substrate-binding protein n=1 Tax=Anaerobranca californiensis DSM 14826 TaxID=1120989 RepID=A0A1M6P578_9FIRM|nr:ABC transporter substrate-binding protein [Anaerobranca californiensis]SHK03081.1 ABC-type glycerol-3-phosphate transport system, substrate-binding protein [Anaerobranca californiensis DSM 14826]
MNKKWIIIGISILLVIILTGSGYFYYEINRLDKRNYNSKVEINPQKNYTIEIWDLKKPHMYVSEEQQIETWKKIVAEFQGQYPNIHLDIRLLDYDEYIHLIEKGIKTKNMADIVIDWLGTPFIDVEMQIPVNRYVDLQQSFLPGTIEYVTYNQKHLAYPLIAIPNMLIGNLNLLEEFEDIIEIATLGWSLEEFVDFIKRVDKSGKQGVNVFDHRGNFTTNLLVQGNVNSITSKNKLNWYGHTLITWFNEIDGLKKEELIVYNKSWLADFWKGKVAILAGAPPWVVTETFKRNEALDQNKIKGAGSTQRIQPIFLPYPYIVDHSKYYGMKQVSAVPFSQRTYKGEDHSKGVIEALKTIGRIYSLELATVHGFIPADNTLTKRWSELNGLDPYCNKVIQLSAENGKPVKSRNYKDLKVELEALEKVQKILDEYWMGKITLQKFLQEIEK